MQVKTLFLWLLPLSFLIGCSSGQKKICKPKEAQKTGYERGLTGSFSLSTHLMKRCSSSNKSFSSSYDKGYLEGIDDFCSEKRGREQASFGLPQESICLNDESYSKGYQENLVLKCSYDLARKDASENLSSSNELCKKVPTYKKKYLQELKNKCSYKYGKKLGYLKKSIQNLCLDSRKLPSFQKGYKKGLRTIYYEENLKLSSDIRTLERNRVLLKKKLKSTTDKNEKIKITIEINKIEGKILDLQSLIEKNKKVIR